MPEALNVPTFTPVFLETDETVRARQLANLPEGLSRGVGSFPRDFLEINNAEDVRLWTMLNTLMAQQYVWWATGQRLEAKAAEYGLTRSEGTFASGNVRFVGLVGSKIAPGTIIEAPQGDPNGEPLKFEVVLSVSAEIPGQTGGAPTEKEISEGLTNYVDVPAKALAVGTALNQPIGLVTLLATQTPGVEEVTNPTAMTNGSNPDTDDTLRAKVLVQAALPVGAGTITDYVAYGLETPDVGAVAVYPEWDTAPKGGAEVTPGTGNPNGTVELSLRDHELMPVDWSVVEACQRNIDPMRQVLALFEPGEPWKVVSGPATEGSDATHKMLGAASLSYTFPGAGEEKILLVRGLDLSRFAPTDDIFLWVYSTNWANVSPGSCKLILRNDVADYFEALFSTVSPRENQNFAKAKAPPATSNGWWLWRIGPAQFTQHGALSSSQLWAEINELEVILTASAATQVNLDYLVQRSEGVVGKGKAPIGASATVVTPVFLNVKVSLEGFEMGPGYTLVETLGETNIKTQVTIALNAFFRELEPGQPVRLTDLIETIAAVPGVIDFHLAEPAANIAVAPTQYAQLSSLSIT